MPFVGNAFIDKVSGFVKLGVDDETAFMAACGQGRNVRAYRDLIREGDEPGPVFVILEGWACRYKVLQDGSRQIMAFLMPGDFCDMHVAVLEAMDHSIATLTTARVTTIPRDKMEALINLRPPVTRAFWQIQLVDEATLRSWIVSVGRRDSLARVSHLMCELYARMVAVGLADEGRCEMPLTQVVLADALGLTAIHVNRTLRKLSDDGVMKISERTLQILDAKKLARIAGFDDNYLHRWLRHAAA